MVENKKRLIFGTKYEWIPALVTFHFSYHVYTVSVPFSETSFGL